MEQREQRITCQCGMIYLVWVNGNAPISDIIMTGVRCPQCGAATGDSWAIINGHSAGHFNVSTTSGRGIMPQVPEHVPNPFLA